MKNKIHRFTERFAGKSHQIESLMKRDPEFVSICADYEACIDAFHYWAQSKAPEAETRVVEYRMLIEGLEEEIHQALEAFNPRQSD